MRSKHNGMSILKWSIVKNVPHCSHITKNCLLRLYEKFELLNYPSPKELLGNCSELFSKCRHINTFLLSKYQTNDIPPREIPCIISSIIRS